jgi:hypothetical protein
MVQGEWFMAFMVHGSWLMIHGEWLWIKKLDG